MSYLTIILLATISRCLAQTTIDPSVLDDIFGKPPVTNPAPASSTQRLEDVTVHPTDSNSVFRDEEGAVCKCLPYYLCDQSRNAVHVQNASVTGWMQLDIRFREDACQESVEVCCHTPKEQIDEPASTPEPVQHKGCGYRIPNGLDFTITGGSGKEAGFGEYPWVVALLNSMNDSYAGVGVLIHPSVVITGAHIAYKYQPGTLKIRAGEWDTQTTKERLPHQERTVQDIYLHSGFNDRTLYNDIALLKLEEPIEPAQHINVICLPEQDMLFDDSRDCVANGWGKDVFGLPGRYAVILKKVEIDMVPFPRCAALLKKTRLGTKFRLHPSFVCAGGVEGKDTCQGDGGAPLACPIGDNRYKLAGLVAWGIGCGQKDVPAVYARVAMYRNWIDDKMADWGYDTSGYSA